MHTVNVRSGLGCRYESKTCKIEGDIGVDDGGTRSDGQVNNNMRLLCRSVIGEWLDGMTAPECVFKPNIFLAC